MINIFIPRHQSTEACVGAVQEVQEVQETLLSGGKVQICDRSASSRADRRLTDY